MERADAAHLYLFLPGQAQVLGINVVYDDTSRCDVPASFRDGTHIYGIFFFLDRRCNTRPLTQIKVPSYEMWLKMSVGRQIDHPK